MREVMAKAEVGDDVYGEDPTVCQLEGLAASLLGTEAALFVSSGTQGNLLALLTHCQRGDEYIVGHRMHSYRSEAGGAAVLGGIQPQPIETVDGVPSIDAIEAAIKPDDFHFPRTRLVCLENTQAGQVLELDYIDQVADRVHERGLKVHLDGARIFNAAVRSGVSAERIAKHVDSISVCLSKGLGAPVGSVLCGTQRFVHEARRMRKLVGGAMRQAGIVAAAGVYVLHNNVERLAEDHANAEHLARGLADRLQDNPHASVDVTKTETNMVFLNVDDEHRATLVEALATRGILLSGKNPIRLVTHLDVDTRGVEIVVDAVDDYFRTHS